MSEVIKLTPHLWVRNSTNGNWQNYYFWCPGCDEVHSFRTKAPQLTPAEPYIPIWQFDGNIDAPTFSPSLLYKRDYWYHIDPEHQDHCKPPCHLVLTGGKIYYCKDQCEHKFVGAIIDMVPIPADYDIV